MFNLSGFSQTKNIFKESGAGYWDSLGQHHVEIRPKELLRWMELCRDDLGYLTLVDITGFDHGILHAGFRFEMVYQLMSMGQHQRLNLHVSFNADEVLPRVTGFFANADWQEREQKELLNLTYNQAAGELLLPAPARNFPLLKQTLSTEVHWPLEKKRSLPVLAFNPNKSEAPYPEESYHWEAHDIFSAHTQGLFEWQICFDPQRVVTSNIFIGYHHQGMEKLLEQRHWWQVMQLVDKLQLGAAPTYSMVWAKALEEVLDITLPERAQAIRMVMLELARVAEHLTVLAEICQGLGCDEMRLFIDAREKLYELFEKYCGHRQGIGIVQLGGLRQDLPHGWIIEYQGIAEIVKKAIYLVHHSLMGQSKFRENLELSPISPQAILKWGVTGPVMRASGLNFDLRKSQPIYFYQDVDFDIPVGINGNSYDRYLIRYEEIFQSFRIITQVLDNLPLGEITLAEYNLNYASLMNIKLPVLWHYSSLESPNGEAGITFLAKGESHPARIKFKTPSFTMAQALPSFLTGTTREQLQANLASFGMRRFEIDR
jgi:NADH-quinone oxidoreductase subunit C/D